MSDKEHIKTALKRPFRAAVVFAGHVGLGAVVALSIWGTQQGFGLLFGDQEPKFFGWIPVKWFFDASKLGVLTVFVVFGTIDAYHKLKR